MGASSRYRSLQYFDAIREAGHEVTQSYFYSDAYLRARYSGKVAYFEILKAFVRRFFALVWLTRTADVVVIEKESFPFLPAFTERLLRLGDAAIIYDYDDAIWHSYEARNFGPLTQMLRGKIARVVAGADHVIVGSQYLKEQVEAWGAPRVSFIPTTVPASKYQGIGQEADKTVDIVWIGSMSTGPYLQEVFPAIERLHAERGTLIRLIGFPASYFNGEIPPYVEICKWSADTELDLLASGRIGIMPLPDSPYERGKCGFKLIQYMGVGLPVIASPVGENSYIVQDGQNGFLVDSAEGWYRSISALLDSPDLAAQMGGSGYERFKERYSTESASKKLLATLEASAISKEYNSSAPLSDEHSESN